MKIFFFNFALVCVIFFFLVGNFTNAYGQLGGNYTINSNIPTSSNNFQSFTDFANALSNQGVNAPVNVDVAPNSGPYNEQFIINSFPGASATNRVTIDGNNDTLAFNPLITDHRVVGFNNARYVTLKNLYIKVLNNSRGFGVHFKRSQYIEIINCKIDMSAVNSYSNSAYVNPVAIVLSDSVRRFAPIVNVPLSHHLKIDSCQIFGGKNSGPYYGVFLSGNSGQNIQNIQLLNSSIKNFHNTGLFISMIESSIVRGNEIDNSERDHTDDAVRGIAFSGALSHSNVIERNRIHSLLGTNLGSFFGPANTITGISCSGILSNNYIIVPAQANYVKNNLIYDLKSRKGLIQGIYSNNISSLNVYNNSILIKDLNLTDGKCRGIRHFGDAANVNYKNNLIKIERNSSANSCGIMVSNSNLNGLTFNYNSIFIDSIGSGQKYYARYGSNYYHKLSDWISGTSNSQSVNSYDQDPLYFNDSNLIALAPHIDSGGIFVGVTHDFFGFLRDSTPDLGAIKQRCFEPNLIKSAVDTTSVRIWWTNILAINEWQIQYDTAGFPIGSGNLVNVSNRQDTIIHQLLPGQEYEFYIRSVCGLSDTGKWSTVNRFYIPQPLSAGNYTIDSSRVTANQNFQSFYDFSESIQKNGISRSIEVEVVQGSGPYINRLVLDSIPGASINNQVIIKGNLEKLAYPTHFNERAIVSFINCKYITLDSLYIEPLSYYDEMVGIFIGAPSSHLTIQNCQLDFTKFGNIFSDYTTGILIRPSLDNRLDTIGNCNHINILNNYIFGSDTGGVDIGISLGKRTLAYTSTDDSNRIINNRITNFGNIGIDLRGQRNLLVERNNITRPQRLHRSSSIDGISFYPGASGNCRISRNRIYDFNGSTSNGSSYVSGIDVEFTNIATSSTPNLFDNNIIYDISSRRANVTGIRNKGNHHFKFYHNTIVLIDHSGSNRYTTGIDASNFSAGGDIRNNLIYINRYGADVYGISIGTIFANATQISNHNNVYVQNGWQGGNAFYGYVFANQYYRTVNDWKNNNPAGIGYNSSEKNPFFKDYQNFEPMNPLLKSTGDDLGILIDFFGNPRDSKPDVGAVEFDSSLIGNLPYYPISTINTEDTLGVSDSLGVLCWTSGSVFSPNLSEQKALQLFISENSTSTQEGIQIYQIDTTYYTAFNPGDSIRVLARVFQREGMTSITADSISLIQSNSWQPSTINSTQLSNQTESKLISLQNLKVIQSFQNDRLQLSKGNDSLWMYISRRTDVDDSLYADPPLIGDTICSVVGVGYQLDETAPYTDNFYIMPLAYKSINRGACQVTNLESIEQQKSSLVLYPNPTNAGFFLESKGSDIVMMKIRNLIGQVVEKLVNLKTKRIHYPSQLPKGAYFVEIHFKDKRTETIRLISQ